VARAVVYQVYLRSFMTRTATGRAIFLPHREARLHCFARRRCDLAVADHRRPIATGGYDVSDYEGVQSRLRHAGRFRCVIAAAHAKASAMLLDEVLCHTPTSMPGSGFAQARREVGLVCLGRSEGRRHRANNWLSAFGGRPGVSAGAAPAYHHNSCASSRS